MLDPIDFHCFNSFCPYVLQNIFFCVSQKKEIQNNMRVIFFLFFIIVSSAVLEEMQLSVQLYSDTTSKSFNMSKNIDWYKLDSQLFSGICLCTTYSCMCFWVLVIWLQWIHVDMLQRQGQFYEAGLTEHLSVLLSALSSTDAAAQVKGRLGLMGSYGRSYLASLSAGLVSVLSSLLPPYNIKGKWTPVWLSPQ